MARNVDDEGKVLDLLVQRRCSEAVSVKLGSGKLMKKQGCAPDVPAYPQAPFLCCSKGRIEIDGSPRTRTTSEQSRRELASGVRRRERKMQRFKSAGSAQRFLHVHAALHNTFYLQRTSFPAAHSTNSGREAPRRCGVSRDRPALIGIELPRLRASPFDLSRQHPRTPFAQRH